MTADQRRSRSTNVAPSDRITETRTLHDGHHGRASECGPRPRHEVRVPRADPAKRHWGTPTRVLRDFAAFLRVAASPRARLPTPTDAVTPRLPRIRVPCAECVQNACVRPRLRPKRVTTPPRPTTPRAPPGTRTPQVVAARTRAPRRRRRRDCAPRRASRRRSTHRGDGFERQLSTA